MPARFTFPTQQDFFYEFTLSNPDGTPYTGQNNITCYASDTFGGAIISGMTAVAATETGTPGTYSATFPAAASTANITGREGDAGYVCVAQAAEVLSADQCVFRATSPAG